MRIFSRGVFNRKLSLRTRKFVGSLIAIVLFLTVTIAGINRYRIAEIDAENYRQYQSAQAELQRQLEIAKHGDPAHNVSGVMDCLDRARDDSCLPELKKLQDLIKKIPGPDDGEFDWWYIGTLWQSSNGAVNGANNDRLVKRAELYGYIDSVEPYLAVNDPTRQKFHAALRQKLIDIDRNSMKNKKQ